MANYSELRTSMVDTQIRPADVSRYDIIDAFSTVPREEFVSADQKPLTYAEVELKVGSARMMATPRTVAKLFSAADLQPSHNILLVGIHAGYEAAILGQIVNNVIAIDEDEGLVGAAEQRLIALGNDKVIALQAPFMDGSAENGPYDRIIFNGAVEQIPESYLSQLTEGGRIVAMVANGHLPRLRVGVNLGGSISWQDGFSAAAPRLRAFDKLAEFEF